MRSKKTTLNIKALSTIKVLDDAAYRNPKRQLKKLIVILSLVYFSMLNIIEVIPTDWIASIIIFINEEHILIWYFELLAQYLYR